MLLLRRLHSLKELELEHGVSLISSYVWVYLAGSVLFHSRRKQLPCCTALLRLQLDRHFYRTRHIQCLDVTVNFSEDDESV